VSRFETRQHLNRANDLAPAGKTFRLCDTPGKAHPRKTTSTETLTNIIDIGRIIVQILEMVLRNSGAEPLRWVPRKSRPTGNSATKKKDTYVQKPVIGLSKAATSFHDVGHVLHHGFLSDIVLEYDGVTYMR
jgi:hypothetical protein